MKNKFEEFYFENDRNYPADVYWDLYDKNHQEAIRKYEGHMFCPLCRLAPLTVAKGEQRRYFKVVQSDMEKQDTKKQICDITISRYVYNYLKEDLDKIPEEKSEAENYYLCFSGIMEKGKYSYKCKLADSRMLILEKEL